MKYCCEKFKEHTLQPRAGIELDGGGKTWNVSGCCGGGCFVMEGIRYCPWCGVDIYQPLRSEQQVL